MAGEIAVLPVKASACQCNSSRGNVEELDAENWDLFHEFLGSLYVDRVTWQKEIESHFQEISKFSNAFLDEIKRLRCLIFEPYDIAREEAEEIFEFHRKGQGYMDQAFSNVGKAMDNLADKLKRWLYATSH